PVAAALAFNASIVKETEKLDKQILVLDLGADSFNISLVSNHDGLYTIEDSVEELNLGGLSFDKVLFEFASDDFRKKYKMDLTENKRSVSKLMNACENTKRALTRQDTAPCFVESLFEGMDYNANIPRARFEVMAEPLYSRCKKVVLDALKKNKVTPEEIDQVLLVGGSSRMPRFQQAMKGLFPNPATEFRSEVEPDEAIALGCACQAGFLEADYATTFDKKVVDAEHISKSIGVKDAGGKFVTLIPHGTPIPVRRSFTIPLSSGQTSVLLALAEQDGADSTSPLAEVALTGIPADVKDGQVEVVLLIEDDHSLQVTLSEQVSGEKVSSKIH
ncbi:Heat shock 70 kDa protein 14, partial [Kappamyces sp. JEL0680]